LPFTSRDDANTLEKQTDKNQVSFSFRECKYPSLLLVFFCGKRCLGTEYLTLQCTVNGTTQRRIRLETREKTSQKRKAVQQPSPEPTLKLSISPTCGPPSFPTKVYLFTPSGEIPENAQIFFFPHEGVAPCFFRN